MNNEYLEPGSYQINQRIGRPGNSIMLEKLIIHQEAFAIFYQAEPNTQMNNFIISKNRREIEYDRGFGFRDSIIACYGKLPPLPFDISFGKDMKLGPLIKRIFPWCFHITNIDRLEKESDISTGMIIVGSSFQIGDNRHIYINHIVTGQFATKCSYGLIKGDFHEMRSEEYKGILYLIAKLDNGEQKEFPCIYNSDLKAFEACDFIPSQATIMGCHLGPIPMNYTPHGVN